MLASSGEIIIPKQSFRSEWKKVLQNVVLGLQFSGYTPKKLIGMERLIKEYELLEREGILYS
ncbi:hypothetical protein [Paenibacillus eucommiae]|uniref:ABC-type nitrate/sulfonate/bicarbonate transport system ATPase subunit n=1 Tax=Paenibacillus eucommiae TaxID=1355755 RepID=A0ABS4IZA5_9BACL|nr:hypothetical protein [Paenibacillus eucommiae]MBP1992922.1 ABC-type nitrate/sulfonate/bicarbonate transport system ATPase subunit [Paenibacillus eucommiae]